jgi:hypothetical protein
MVDLWSFGVSFTIYLFLWVLICPKKIFQSIQPLVGCGSFSFGSFFVLVGVESSVFKFWQLSLVHLILVDSSAQMCSSVITENIKLLVGSRAYHYEFLCFERLSEDLEAS